MQKLDWSKIKKIHIIGIGGIGLSALARLLRKNGKVISGCDRSPSIVTDALVEAGLKVESRHDAGHISKDTDLIIYSDAILEGTEGYVERIRGRELHIPELSYFEALGQIAKEYKVIAVAGAHGKTTTTAMLTDVLEAGELDPTAVIGSLRAKTKSNFRAGEGKYFIVEADEFKRHFLNFSPYILVITNIDADHLDYYKDIKDIQSAFHELAGKVPKNGCVVCDPESKTVAPVIKGIQAKVLDYKKYFDPQLPLKVLTLHRINAAAVLAVADLLKIDSETARRTIGEFSGTWRRFEYKGKTRSGAEVYDDYAHHPLEIKTTLASIREQFPDKKILVAFHPHLYSRTKIFMDDFAKAFDDADDIIIAPIFAAREEPDPGVTSDILAQKIRAHNKQAQTLDSFEEIEKYLDEYAQEGDLILTMGAGDIYKVGEKLVVTKP